MKAKKHREERKKDEYKQVAQTVVAQWKRPTGVGNGCGNRGQSNNHHRPAPYPNQVQADQSGQAKDRPHPHQHVGGGQQAGLSYSHRTEPFGGVCPFLVVEYVVG